VVEGVRGEEDLDGVSLDVYKMQRGWCRLSGERSHGSGLSVLLAKPA
jgi:hypothetical protein